MKKINAILELFYLSFLFVVSGLWHIIWNNKRIDYAISLKPLLKKKDTKKILVKYLENCKKQVNE